MRIHHVAITVNDLDESINFYTEMLEFEVVERFEIKDLRAKGAFIDLDGFWIELFQFESMKENSDILADIKIRGIRHIAFEVNNLNKVINRLRENGLTVSEPKMGSSGHNYSFTQDPNCISLEFYEK